MISQKESQSNKVCTDLFIPDLSALSFSMSAEKLGREQRSDSSLDVLFQSAGTPAEVGNLARS